MVERNCREIAEREVRWLARRALAMQQMADDVGQNPQPSRTATNGRLRPTSIRSTSISAVHVVARSASTTVATASETS